VCGYRIGAATTATRFLRATAGRCMSESRCLSFLDRSLIASDLMPTRSQPTDPTRPPKDDERDRKDEDTPETPPTEAPPVPVKEPPEGPDRRGPFVVG